MADKIICIQDLTKYYGRNETEIRALDGVSLDIDENEYVAIMGASGSGKSTLMNILGCLDRPTAGKYILAGEDVSDLNRSRLAEIRNKRIGFIFQAYNLLPNTPAWENVLTPLLYDRKCTLTRTQQKERSLRALKDVGLAERVNHLPHELSGGQMQRVAIARALINDPVLILADEPTGNLDSHSSLEIMAILSLLHQKGSTIVMVTHEESIAAYARRVIRMRDGKIDSDVVTDEPEVPAVSIWARPMDGDVEL